MARSAVRVRASSAWVRALLAGVLLASGAALGLPGRGTAMRALGIKAGKLDLPSGLRIVVQEDHSQPLVAMVVVVDAGASQDPPGKEGLAHLVEHLTFRARPDGKVQRSNLLDFAGAGTWNGSTSHDQTTYVAVGPTEAFKPFLAIEWSRLLKPLAGLDAKTFESERSVVLNEIAQSDEEGRNSAVEQRLYAALYPNGHPYHRPTVGTEASVSSLTLADAEAFVQKYYLLRNVTLYIAGDLDPKALSLPSQMFEAPAGGAVVPPQRMAAVTPPVPPLAVSKALDRIRAPVDAPMLYIAWSMPGGFGADGYLARFTASAFAGVASWAGGESSDVEGVRTWLDQGKHGTTLIAAVLLKEGKNPERSLERVLDQAFHLWEPPKAQHFQGIAQLSNDYYFQALQSSAMVFYARQAESVVDHPEEKAELVHLAGDPQAWVNDIGAIGKVNVSQTQDYVFKWLARDRARAVFVEPSGGPGRVLLPGRSLPFAPWDDVQVRADPAAMKTHLHGPGGDLRSFTLKNGLDVVLVRRPDNPTVTVTLGLRGGTATGEPLGASELAQMLGRPLKTRNGPAQIFGGSVHTWADVDTTYVSGSLASGNLENMLAILSDRVQSMDVDTSFKLVWPEVVAIFRRSEARKSSETSHAFLGAIYPGSAYGRAAGGADVEKLTSSDAQQWMNRTYRPGNAVIAVVGDLEFTEAERQVRDWFGGWGGAVDPGSEAPIRTLGERTGPPAVLKVERPGAKQTEIRLGCSMLSQDPTELVALRLLGVRLRDRVRTRARSTLGGSYGFEGGAVLHRQAANLDVVGTVDDAALTRVLALARKELDELGSLQISEEELNLLKWRLGVAFNVRYATNAQLAQGLVDARRSGLPVDFVQKLPDLLAAVTPADLARVAGACRRTAALVISGDPGVVAAALQSTVR